MMIKKRSAKEEKEHEIETIKIAIPIVKKKLEVAKKRNRPKDIEQYAKAVEALEELLASKL